MFRSLLRFQRSSAEEYVNVAGVVGPVTVRPAPFACAAVVAFRATSILISATETVVEFTVVVVPETVKFPPTTTSPLVVTVAKLTLSVVATG